MAHSRSTVTDFIANGKIKATEATITFDGFEVRGDAGNGLAFFKTGEQSTSSQSPIDRGDNSFTDSEGFVYSLLEGSSVSYDGSNDWFGGSFGVDGLGVYTLSSQGWSVSSSVAESLAVVSGIDWDVEIDLKYDLSMKSGVGTRDGNGFNSVSFSRANEGSAIDQSGYLDYLSEDEAGFSSDGILLHGEYENLATYSEDFSYWNSLSQTTTELVDGEIGFNNINLITSVQDGTVNSRKASIFGDTVEAYTLSAVVKKGTASIAKVGTANGVLQTAGYSVTCFFDFDNEEVSHTTPTNGTVESHFKYIGNGYYLFWVSVYGISGVSSGANNIDVGMHNASAGDTLYVACMQVTTTDTIMPYRQALTDSTAEAYATVATIPVRKNLPANNLPLSILVDLSTFTRSIGRAFTVGNQLRVRVTANGNLQFVFSDSNSVALTLTSASNISEIPVRGVFVFTGEKIELYFNGTLEAEASCVGSSYNVEGTAYLGSINGSSEFLNGAIKNFKIAHRALSADEVASLGGYK